MASIEHPEAEAPKIRGDWMCWPRASGQVSPRPFQGAPCEEPNKGPWATAWCQAGLNIRRSQPLLSLQVPMVKSWGRKKGATPEVTACPNLLGGGRRWARNSQEAGETIVPILKGLRQGQAPSSQKHPSALHMYQENQHRRDHKVTNK